MPDVDEILESPAFWMLGGLGVGAELLGYIYGKNNGMEVFSWWQLIIIILGTIVISAAFSGYAQGD
jgi:hypothetical protein